MQDILSLALGMCLALTQFVFLCVIGFLFFKMKWFTPDTIDGVNRLIRKFFFPCLIISNLIKVVKLESAHQDWIIVMIPFLSLLVNMVVGFLSTILLKTDYRVRWLFIMTAVSGNSGLLSSILARSSCQSGGILHGDTHCDEAWGYIQLSQIPQIFCLFIGSLSIFFREGQFTQQTNAKLKLLLTVYKSRKELLQDSNLAQINDNSLKNGNHDEAPSSQRNLIDSNPDQERIKKELHIRLNSHKQLKQIDRAFEKLLLMKQFSMIKRDTFHQRSLCKITMIKMVSAINITMILVCLLSLIEPVRQFLLREDGVIPMFRDTIQQSAMTGIVLLTIVFGSSIGGLSFKVKDKYIGKREVCSLLVIKFVIIPVVGIFIMKLFSTHFDILASNAVLGFVLYTHWICPVGVMMSVIALTAKHGAKDVSYLSFWQYIMMPVPIIIFVSLHQSLNY